MSRKTKKTKSVTKAPNAAPRPSPRKKLAAALAVSLLLGAAFAATRFDPVRRAVGLRPLPAPAAQGPAGSGPAKEYIYAGGRLVATGEAVPPATPTPTPAGPSPTNVVASLASVSGTTASINVSWTPPSSGLQVGSYVVERRTAGADFTQVGQVAAPGTSFNDAGASEGAAYLYRVKALFAGGGGSDYSNSDMATAVAFTDDPLIGENDPQNRQATTVYARHLTELRRAVSAVHSLAGLGGVTTWTHPDPASSPPEVRRTINLEDVQDLRDRLREALQALVITEPTYLDATLTRYATKVKKEHFQQLREAVK
jgi:hypothetical protein